MMTLQKLQFTWWLRDKQLNDLKTKPTDHPLTKTELFEPKKVLQKVTKWASKKPSEMNQYGQYDKTWLNQTARLGVAVGSACMTKKLF